MRRSTRGGNWAQTRPWGLPELQLVVFWGHLMETKLTTVYRDIMFYQGNIIDRELARCCHGCFHVPRERKIQIANHCWMLLLHVFATLQSL
jgi:hypothetical protein